MKAENVVRANTLLHAREAFASFADTARAENAGDLTLRAEKIADNGGYFGVVEIEIDSVTAMLLLPTIQGLIDQELLALGVDVDGVTNG